MDIQHIARPLAIKSRGADGTFMGYASVFGALDSQNEIVAPGAFRRTLAGWKSRAAPPAMLWMHDPTLPIAWAFIGRGQKRTCGRGQARARHAERREAYELLKLGALTGLSIGYRVC